MKRKIAVLSGLVLLILVSAPHVSLSQMRRSYGTMRPSRMRDLQRMGTQPHRQSTESAKEFARIRNEYSDEAAQEALGADAEQWKRIEEKMIRIRELHRLPALTFVAYGFAEGGTSDSASESHFESRPSRQGGLSRNWRGGGSAGGAVGGSAGSLQSGTGGNGGATGGSGGYGYRTGSSSGSSYGYGFGGGAGPKGDRPVKKTVGELSLGWIWQRPSERKEPDEMTEADKTCEQALDAMEAKEPDPERVRQHIEQLRQLRRERQRQLQEVQQQLRDIVTPEQEAKLILMGYLD